jgi:hypothetical protein
MTPAFEEGDRVWLNTKNILTHRPSRNLDHRRIGNSKIVKVVSPWAYKLELPEEIQIHPVEHVSYLDPVDEDPFPGQRTPPPPPDGEDEWYVDEILDSRMRRRRFEYLVKWTGYEEADWRPAETLNELEAVDDIHRWYPNKPGPLLAPEH